MRKQKNSPTLHRARKERDRRRTWLAPALVIVFVAAFIPLAFLLGGKQTTLGASQGDAAGEPDCRELIAQAMLASGRSCDGTGPNQACYGNTIVQAELAPDTSQRFSERGDIVDIDRLVRLSAAPLDLNRQVWGVAVLRILANLPRSLPGETVTMIVFGNTTLGSQASNLQSFYFYSEVGQIACAELPYDGIMISMPDGTGIDLMVNGAELTLMGKASLNASRNGQMDVNLYEGSARVAVGGQAQDLGPGEQVSVELGGPDGTDAIGPPSAPEPLSPEDLSISCTVSGQNCPATETPPVVVDTAQATIDSTLEVTPTLTMTVAAGQAPTRTSTSPRTPTRTPTASRAPASAPTLDESATSAAPLASASKTPITAVTRTPSQVFTTSSLPSKTPANVVEPSATASKVPPLPSKTPVNTVAPSATPSKVPPPTKIPTDTVPTTSPADSTVAPADHPAATVAPLDIGMSLDGFVVLAQEGLFLEQNCIVHSGNVAANTSSTGPYLAGNEEVVIGIGVTFQLAASQVTGDSILLKNNSEVYDVFYNDITENGTVIGNHFTPLALPLVAGLPAVPSFTPGTSNYSLATGEAITLDAGNYGQLDTKAQATVTFTGGVYTFAGWSIGQDSSLLFLAPTEIRIAGRLDTNSGTYIGPADGSGLSAADILIIVTGINGSTGAVGATPKALQIGQANTLIANFYVPYGTLFLRQNTIATGAFLGRWVDIGPGVELTLESAFH